MIEFQNVTYAHQKGPGVNNLSLTIEDGEFSFLIGPTGSGKTTLMRLMYFDLLPDAGRVKVNGFSSKSMTNRKIPKARKMIGMVFQDYKLLDDRNLFENVALPLHISGLPKKDIKSKVSEILEKVGLDSVTKMRPSQLSGGEQQRVSIARALVKDPVVILADEPTGNLDPNVSDEILDLLELATNNGTSVLMSTHNFPLIRPRKKRYIELNDGRLVQK